MLNIDVEKITLVLYLHKGRTFPVWNITPENSTSNEIIIDDDSKRVSIEITLNQDTMISLYNLNKTTNETIVDSTGNILKDQSIRIERIFVNDIQLELQAIKNYFRFIPQYTASRIKYAQEHRLDLPSELSTEQLFDNGVWTFTFQRPFFLWYNSILMDLINNSNTNVWVKRSHLGLPGDNTLSRLDSLLGKL